MKMRIFVILLLAATSISCFDTQDTQTRSSKTKESTFKKTYRKDPRPVCQSKPLKATSSNQNERHLIKPNILGIANGRPAARNEFPYATVLFKNKVTGGNIANICGGTLITDQHVLTARHCIKYEDMQDVDMSIGEIDLGKNKSHLISNASGFYEGVGALDDIAIIELAHPVTFGENKVIKRNVYVADLPGPDYVIKKGEVMSIFGWGKTSKNKEPLYLQTANVRLDDKDKKLCNESEKFSICVVGAHSYENACFGDSGNGLIYRDYGKEVVVGVMSSAQGNCDEKHVELHYTRVSAYAEYVYKHTLDAGCKPSFVFSHTFEDRYRNDPRPVCQGKPFNVTSSVQNERHLNKPSNLSIVNGRRFAVKNEFPYATVLFKNEMTRGNLTDICGATLITDQHVLTTRHCINSENMEDVDMSISEIDLREDKPHLISNTSGIYKGIGWINDIGIIELSQPVTFGYNKVIKRNVYVADLPGPDYVIKKDEVMSILGWGTPKSEESLYLQTANVRLVNHDEKLCNNKSEFSIFVVGVHPYEDVYIADSGNGLIYRDYGREVAVGIMIKTDENCYKDKHVKMEYLRVSNYAEYIYNHTLDAGCKPSFIFPHV